jgi:hypothetical protein
MGKLFAFGPLVAMWATNIDDRDAAGIRSLASKRDLRSLGCLLSFYNVGNRHIRETVEAVMLDMLPRAREADGLTLEAGDRVALHKLLHSRAVEIAVVASSIQAEEP